MSKSSKEEEDDSDPKFLEYDLEELYELLGSFSQTVFLILTHTRDHKKHINVDSTRDDYVALGRRQYGKYCEEVKEEICKEWVEEKENFSDPQEAYCNIMRIISKTDIPEYAGGVVGAIIVKVGLYDFCKNAV
ncbi:MAG: hypothetical protein SVM80_07225 [Halobacteriota archaeon]|nr:hypothetical protein [Halobacteriota archaeon]